MPLRKRAEQARPPVVFAPMTRAKRYASSTDVARLAGVSQSAVSRTYQAGASVSAETRRKVIEAATALDYRPSLIPQIMLTHRSRLVAVVVGGPGESLLFSRGGTVRQAPAGARLPDPAHAHRSGSLPGRRHPAARELSGGRRRQRSACDSETCAEALAPIEGAGGVVQHAGQQRLAVFGLLGQRRCRTRRGGALHRARRASFWLHWGPGQQRGKPGQARRLPLKTAPSGSRSADCAGRRASTTRAGLPQP